MKIEIKNKHENKKTNYIINRTYDFKKGETNFKDSSEKKPEFNQGWIVSDYLCFSIGYHYLYKTNALERLRT